MTGDIHNEFSGGSFFSMVIQGRDITVQLPPQITPALSGLPAGSSAFTGRNDDLRSVLDMLAPSSAASGRAISGDETTSAVVVTAVGGMGGVGKTELAIQAARAALNRGWFPGGVLFVDLFGYDLSRRIDPGHALDGFLRALGIPGEHIPSDTQDRARLYTSVLTAYAQQGKPILVVVDNASSTEQVRPLLPIGAGNRMIATSRHILGMLGARLLDLNVLTLDEALALLDRALCIAHPHDTRISDHPTDAAALATLCAGLPLALQIVAALLADDLARPLSAMVTDLADNSSRLARMEYGDVAIRAAFELSYRHLDDEQARLFRLLPINPGPDVSTDTVAVLADRDPVAVRRLLEALARAHLIEHGSAYGRWRMHDLLRLYADEHSRTHADVDGREQALTTLLEHYMATVRAADRHLNPTDPDPATDGFPNREQALAWLDAEHPNLVAVVYTAATYTMDRTIVRDLPLTLVNFLDWRRLFTDWVTLATHALHAARNIGDHHGEGAALTSLGLALIGIRRFEEAIVACQDAATIFREIGDRHREGMALGNRGLALIEVRRFDEAITSHRQNLQICREIGDRHGEGMALTNLGAALVEVQRFEESIIACEDAATIFREIGDRHREGMALGNLGLALREVGRFEEAITSHWQDLQICREIGDRHGEGMALGNLGLALIEVQRFEEAITRCQEAADIYRETSDRHGEGMALGNLGLALREIRRFEEAITAYRQHLRICRETGDRHGEGVALGNIGLALREMQRFEEAITGCQEAAVIFRETGDRHGEGVALGNIGLALSEMQRFDEAITIHKQHLRICRETSDRHGEGVALGNFGLALREVRRFEEAVAACQDAVDIYRELGDQPRENTAMSNLEVVQKALTRTRTRTRNRHLALYALIVCVSLRSLGVLIILVIVIVKMVIAIVKKIRGTAHRRRSSRSSSMPNRNGRSSTDEASGSTGNAS